MTPKTIKRICTLEFLINVAPRLLILGIFSRGYALIWEGLSTIKGGTFIHFGQKCPGGTIIKGGTFIWNSRVSTKILKMLVT